MHASRRLFRSLASLLFATLLFICAPTTVVAQSLTSFSFNDFTSGSNKIAGLPFNITITALDEFDAVLSSFTGTVSLTDTTGSINPTTTTAFESGVWTGPVYITDATTNTSITATYLTVVDASSSFVVEADSRIKFLSIISGNSQTGSVLTQLPSALTARVVDPFNNPIANVGVNFAVTSAPPGSTGQSLTATSAISNASGNASTSLTLGRKQGVYVTTATLNTGITNAVHFYETATPGILLSIGLTPSVGVVPAGGYLPFTATGYDAYLNEISLTSPTWAVANGGGTIDNTGVFTAGGTKGTFSNSVTVTSGSIGASATVTVVGAAGEAGGTATGSAAFVTPVPTPTPRLNPVDGVLYNVQIDPAVIAALENARIPIVAEGVDIFGNQVEGVTYEFSSTGSLGSLTQTGPNTALLQTSSAGLGSVSVTATQGDISISTGVVGSIGNGLNRRLIIEDVASPQRVGEPFTLSIAAKDSANNFITDYEGPIVIADTTGTIDPAVAQPSDEGIWYVQAVITLANPETTITVAGDGMVGVSNIFEVVGEPSKADVGPGLGLGAGLGEVLGASISALIDELLLDKDLNRFTIFRYIGSGLAAGFGILGASIGGGIMVSRGLEAIGRNPYAKSRLKVNLYASLMAFVIAASLAVFAAFLILR